MKPLVSICIPTYNGEAFIAETIDSAISQTYSNLEIIISDDESEDNTLKLIEAYTHKTTIPISIYHHQPNGIGANWNHCVKQSKGAYIKFLFQDDVLEPTCIEKMMQLALSHPNVGLVYCKRTFILEGPTQKFKEFVDSYGTLHTHWNAIKVEQGILSGKRYLKDSYFLKSPANKIGEPTAVLLKRDCFNRIGFFSETLKQALDCHYWYMLMPKYNIGFVDENLVKFRLHDNQATAINKKSKIREGELLLYEYYKNLLLYLKFVNQVKLLKRFNPLVKALVVLKRKLNV